MANTIEEKLAENSKKIERTKAEIAKQQLNQNVIERDNAVARVAAGDSLFGWINNTLGNEAWLQAQIPPLSPLSQETREMLNGLKQQVSTFGISAGDKKPTIDKLLARPDLKLEHLKVLQIILRDHAGHVMKDPERVKINAAEKRGKAISKQEMSSLLLHAYEGYQNAILEEREAQNTQGIQQLNTYKGELAKLETEKNNLLQEKSELEKETKVWEESVQAQAETRGRARMDTAKHEAKTVSHVLTTQAAQKQKEDASKATDSTVNQMRTIMGGMLAHEVRAMEAKLNTSNLQPGAAERLKMAMSHLKKIDVNNTKSLTELSKISGELMQDPIIREASPALAKELESFKTACDKSSVKYFKQEAIATLSYEVARLEQHSATHPPSPAPMGSISTDPLKKAIDSIKNIPEDRTNDLGAEINRLCMSSPATRTALQKVLEKHTDLLNMDATADQQIRPRGG